MLTGAIALSLLSLNVHALSVGKMNIESYLGEPLDISIDVQSISKSELSTLDVSLASRALFTQAGIQYPENADNIQVQLDSSADDDAKILVTSSNSVSDPFVHLLLQISWSGGNMLREYTALLDPSDYQVQPIVKAAAPATKLGIVKSAPKTTLSSDTQYHPPVADGDSLSSIAALYRPADVSIQQAWMAFYNLNRSAFPDDNLNKITKGARLRIPTAEEMRAIPKSQAYSDAKQLTRPLKKVAAAPAPAPVHRISTIETLEPAAPTLVVGGAVKKAAPPAVSAPAAAPAVAAQDLAISDLKGYEQFATVVTEMGQFTQTVREQNKLFKDELVVTRGENKVLANRMANLEAQLGKMSQLLEMQSQALQAMNTQAAQPQAVELTKVDAPAPTPAPAPVVIPEPVAAPVVAEAPAPVTAEPATAQAKDDDNDGNKTYYEQLLEGAITDASEADKSYIEEIIGQSSTSMGMPDDNPVTAEMQIAAATPPAMPNMPADKATEMMMANVRASLGNLQGLGQGTAPVDTMPDLSNIEIKVADQDLAYLEALNEDDRGEIQKSEQRIADLERQLQEKLAAAQAPQAVAPQAAPAQATPTSQAAPAQAPATPARVAPPADEGIMGSISGMLSGIMESIGSVTSGISSEVWKLLAGAGIGILALMAVLGFRSRREEMSDDTDILPGQMSDMSTTTGSTSQAEFDDLSDFGARNSGDEAEMDIELHGSSMFDLSDESFMASEAIQDDSSLFAMDDDNSDMESLGDMDSTMMGGHDQSTLTAVDVDPIAEAEVYLAYDRKEQAIEVLEQSLKQNSNQPTVVTKLLGLYQSTENKDNFTTLFEASAGNIEDDEEWDKIKRMAKEVVPDHDLLADDFDSSIPVLMDELVDTENEVLDVDESEVAEEESTEDLFAVAAANLDKLDAEEAKEEITEAAAEKAESGLSLSLSDEPLGELAMPAVEEDSSSIGMDLESDRLEDELDDAMEEVNQHDPETALALAKAYIDLGEEDIAKDFLNDVVRDGDDEAKADAEKLLASMG